VRLGTKKADSRKGERSVQKLPYLSASDLFGTESFREFKREIELGD
jgi:hypothetical protein